ncbi:efflux RND transporter periplasmic adaptor subunit [Flavobacterium macacae]|uniref:Efflux RND transporter periplasmic adaptor subunit n=1 Tax=Flavobacterium macacae TaxID=2488993 RepID=A0A3P3WH72_9FLAO|nr:efflux RND transporter periplasmic adaptor subunit [Flavobacterium macacae]RRJ93877.1 efflux RND transporter periplasmic adaptor subunit [Flavobacterium macacae]
MKKVIYIVVIVAVIGLIGYKLTSNKDKNEAETAVVAEKNTDVAVRADTVNIKEVSSQYIANSTFLPKQEVMLSADASGLVRRVLVEEGAFVKAGQTLAIIDGDKLNVNVANAQAVYKNAQVEYSRFESAYKTGGVTKQQLDQTRLQLENAKNSLRSSQLAASDVNIKASFSGIINKRNVEPGLYVNPGKELFEIVDVTSLKLKVNVDEKNISSLKLGQTVKVTAQILSDKTFEGKITFIAPKADGSLNFPVELEIKNNSSKDLKAGMYGTAYFGSDQKVEALVAPRTAFVGSISSGQIFVIKDGKVTLTKVTTGRSFGDYIEITTGIEKGTPVVVSGQINLSDGTAVQIIK